MKGLALIAISAICCVPIAVTTISVMASNESVSDEITLTIDYGEYKQDELPVGKVGKSYGVFDYSATDGAGNEVSDVAVYVFSPANEILALNGNRFNTATEGQYTITYIAKKSGVYTQKDVTITVDNVECPMFYEMNESVISVSNTGETVFVADGTYGGGVGEIKIDTKVLYESSTVVYQEETATGFWFKPEKAGKYQIVYEMTDFVGSVKTESKEIIVSDSQYPVMEKPSIMDKYILNREVSLPIVHGMLYTNGEKYYVPVKVYYDTEDITAEMKFTADKEGAHTLKYVCESILNPEIKTEYTYAINVVNPDASTSDCVFNDYISLNNMSIDVPEEATEYHLKTGASGNAFVSFNSSIPTEFLSVGFSIEEKYKKYDSINLIYTDSVNQDEQVIVNIGKLSQYGNTFYGILDVKSKAIVSDTGVVLVDVPYYADGRAFKGFSSGRAYVGIQMVGLNEEVVLSLQYIASSSVTTASRDKTAPLFLTNDSFKEVMVANYQQQITVVALEAYDFFDGDAEVSLTVTAPDETEVYKGKLTQAYIFTVEQYGEYKLEYIAKDSKNNRKKMVATVKVVDIIPPEIETVKLKSEVSVGETVTFSPVVATDNSATELLTYIYVSYGNFIKELVVDEYTFSEKGEYIVRYVAYDNNQNYSMVEYVITCK